MFRLLDVPVLYFTSWRWKLFRSSKSNLLYHLSILKKTNLLESSSLDGLTASKKMEAVDHIDKISNSSDLSEDSGCKDCTQQKTMLEECIHHQGHQIPYDVYFVAQDKKDKIYAHKNILIHASKVFTKMFKEADANKQDFHIPDNCFHELGALLRYVYGVENNPCVSDVMGILFAADEYQMLDIKLSCLTYLHNCIEVNNASELLTEARFYGYSAEEKIILSFIGKHLSDVLQTKGVDKLTRGLLNEVLTLPGQDVNKMLKKDVAERWAINHCEKMGQDINEENIMSALHDCFYIDRDNSSSHRYVMDSVTSRNIFEDHEQPETLYTQYSTVSRRDDLSPATSTRTSSVCVLKRLSSANMWPDLQKVTRLQKGRNYVNNDAICADAISFTVNCDLYLYGISIYGPKNHEEGSFQIDTILYQKKKAIVMETIHVKGTGVILPVLFERPAKIDKTNLYTLEIYIKGPTTYIGGSGQTQIQSGPALFTFSNTPKIKKNRSDINKGQIPQLYFLLREKKLT